MDEINSLRQALGAMATLPQFFLYELSPDPDRSGKTVKTPWRENVTHGAEDRRFWLPFDDAARYLAYARQRGHVHPLTMGFAFTRDCGYWFVDVDGQRDTPFAQWVLQQFPGAACEVSSSGTGFHLFGRGTVPDHSKRNATYKCEFYTEGRGVAFGLVGPTTGSADTDHTHIINTVWVPQLFQPRAADDAVWTGQPRADWRGPTDDDDLIRRALASQSVASAFSDARATFADLWECNVPVLQRAYPDDNADGFNRSQADMALAQHLAFWTGCDGPRIERLMWRSALAREKWKRHQTYLRDLTITGACGMQTKVLCDQPKFESSDPTPDGVRGAEGNAVDVSTFLTATDQLTYFAGCAYVIDSNSVFTPRYGGMLLSSDRFNAAYGGRSFCTDAENEHVTKKAFEAFTLNQAVKFPRVRSTAFRPDLEPGTVITRDGIDYINTYWPIAVPAVAGDISLFDVHMRKLFPVESDRAIMLAYMAAVVQHKGVKFQWCPVLQGVQGNGKSTIGEIIAWCIGERYSGVVNPDDLNSNFTGWLDQKIFIMANDVYINGDKKELIEKLKPIISDVHQRTEVKGGAQETRRICANFLLSMNERDGLRLDPKERRYAVFYTPQQRIEDLIRDGMDGAYFVRLYGWLESGGYAAVHAMLRDYPIPEELNPAGRCRRAPATSTQGEAIAESMGEAETIVALAVQAGTPGFAGGWINMDSLKTLLTDNRRYMKESQKKRMLEEMGYIPHPQLGAGGMSHNPIEQGKGRVRLWVRRDHATVLNTMRPADIENAYRSAQHEAITSMTSKLYQLDDYRDQR